MHSNIRKGVIIVRYSTTDKLGISLGYSVKIMSIKHCPFKAAFDQAGRHNHLQ